MLLNERFIKRKIGIIIMEIQKCILCEKEFDGYGNNAQPLAEGRCCDNCNLEKVIPARLQNQTKNDIMQSSIMEAPKGEIFTDEVFFKNLGIPENDRLKNFQLVRKYWEAKMNTYGEEDWIGKEQMNLLRIMWRNSYKASMDEAKVFSVEDDVMPLLLHTDCKDANFPFQSFFIDAKIQIRNRTYFGFHIGSYYTEKTKYKAILTSYTKYIMYKGEFVKFLIPDFILLKRDNTDEELPFREKDFYHERIKNIIYSFCYFINEPDISIISHPLNPKNNIRRMERGIMPLPEYKKIVIHGKLRMYIDNMKKEWQGGTHASASYRYWVRGFYRHFFDKKKYAKLYALTDDEREKAGFTFSQKHKNILRRWVKPFIKGQGILIKQRWEVTE